MPITFEQPQPVNAGIGQAYGEVQGMQQEFQNNMQMQQLAMQQQQLRNQMYPTPLAQWQAQNQANLLGAQMGNMQAIYGTPQTRFDLQQQAANQQAANTQTALSQRLQPWEQTRYNQIQQGMSHMQSDVSSGLVSPDEFNTWRQMVWPEYMGLKQRDDAFQANIPAMQAAQEGNRLTQAQQNISNNRRMDSKSMEDGGFVDHYDKNGVFQGTYFQKEPGVWQQAKPLQQQRQPVQKTMPMPKYADLYEEAVMETFRSDPGKWAGVKVDDPLYKGKKWEWLAENNPDFITAVNGNLQRIRASYQRQGQQQGGMPGQPQPGQPPAGPQGQPGMPQQSQTMTPRPYNPTAPAGSPQAPTREQSRAWLQSLATEQDINKLPIEAGQKTTLMNALGAMRAMHRQYGDIRAMPPDVRQQFQQAGTIIGKALRDASGSKRPERPDEVLRRYGVQ
jgi:hypothetical protein